MSNGYFRVPTFLGTNILQTWGDLEMWEEFFSQHAFLTFIELGSGAGGSSLFFALQCHIRGIQFHSFDHQNFVNFGQGLSDLLGWSASFHHVDLFSEEGQAQVKAIIDNGPHPMAIFFDNGDKPREWQLFAPLTQPGDYCIVHDWGKEFKKKHLSSVAVETIMDDRSRPPRWKSAWFRRV